MCRFIQIRRIRWNCFNLDWRQSIYTQWRDLRARIIDSKNPFIDVCRLFLFQPTPSFRRIICFLKKCRKICLRTIPRSTVWATISIQVASLLIKIFLLRLMGFLFLLSPPFLVFLSSPISLLLVLFNPFVRNCESHFWLRTKIISKYPIDMHKWSHLMTETCLTLPPVVTRNSMQPIYITWLHNWLHTASKVQLQSMPQGNRSCFYTLLV